MDQRDKIINETFQLTLRYGIKSVSMDDIARKLGISKKTLYQHFGNKQDLLKEMVLVAIAQEEADIKRIVAEADNALDAVISIARHFLQFLRGMSPSFSYDMKKYYPDVWRLVDNHNDEFAYKVMYDNIERGKEEGLYRTDINVDIIAKLYVQMCRLITDEDIFPLASYTKTDLYHSIITYHIQSLVSAQGRTVLDKTIIQ